MVDKITISNKQSIFLSFFLNNKKKVFILVTVLISILILVLTEIGLRVFKYGSNPKLLVSSTDENSNPRALKKRFSDIFTYKLIKVISTWMTAIKSCIQLDFMGKILAQKPDALLIYSGHSEYYGAIGVGSMESAGINSWIIKTSLSLQKFRLYQLMRNIKTGFNNITGIIQLHESPFAALMERIVVNK